MAPPNYTPQLATILQGLTSQQLAALASSGGSVENSSSYEAAGNPNPEDARAGYLAAGQPSGPNADVIVPNTDGSGASGGTLQTVSAPAGTSGGGGQYPSAGASAVPDPMTVVGWTSQASANVDAPALAVVLLPEYSFVHATAQTITPTISGGTSPYDVVLVESLVDGADTNATLPTGFTLTATTGVLTLSTSTVAGTYQLAFRVNDSSTPEQFDTYSVTIVLS